MCNLESDADCSIQAYSLQLRPQSGRQITPQQQHGVRQEIQLDGIDLGKGNSVRLRYKVSYKVGDQAKDESGLVPSLGIA